MLMRSLLPILVGLALLAGPSSGGERPMRLDRHGDPLPEGAIGRLGTSRFRTCAQRVRSLQFSPDGRTLLSIDDDGNGRLWRAATGKEQARFTPSHDSTWCLAADADTLAFLREDQSIRVSDPVTGRTVRELTAPDHVIHSLCLAPNGKALAAVVTPNHTADWALRVWGLPDGWPRRDLPIRLPKEDQVITITGLHFTTDGKALLAEIVQAESVVLRRWSFPDGEELPVLPKLFAEHQRPTFSPDGNLVAAAALGEKGAAIRLLDAARGTIGRELATVMPGRALGICFAPDGRTVAAVVDTSDGDQILLWDTASGKELPGLVLDGDLEVAGVAFSQDGRLLAVLGEDFTTLFETATGKRLHQWKTPYYPFPWPRQSGFRRDRRLPRTAPLAISPDGKVVATAQPGEVIRLWDTATGKEVPGPNGHKLAVITLAFSPDGRTVASAGDDDCVRLWETANQRELRVLPVGTAEALGPREWSEIGHYCVAFSPDGEALVTVSRDNKVKAWSVRSGACRWQYPVEPGGVSELLFSPDGRRVIVGAGDTVFALSAETGKSIVAAGKLDLPDSGPNVGLSKRMALALSPDGRLLAVAGRRPTVDGQRQITPHELRIFELATGKLRWQAPRGDGAERVLERRRRFSVYRTVDCQGAVLVAFAPDGKTLAWNQGESIELVDALSGAPLQQFGPRCDEVEAIAFSPTGDLLAIACYFGAVHLVDARTGAHRGLIDTRDRQLECIAFSPDGRTLATGSSDTTALLWDVQHALDTWRARSGVPSPPDLQRLWQLLASEKGTEAGEAIAQLQAARGQAVTLLREHLHPVPPVAAGKVGRLLEDLDNDNYVVREAATRELEKLGDLAEPFVRERLAETRAVEVRRRLRAVLEVIEGLAVRPEQMRIDRGVEVLEHIGTAEAQVLLRELAEGAPDARLTQEAKASLRRLARRDAGRP
jgi:WD40 repeat protein